MSELPWWRGWLPLLVLPLLATVLIPAESPRWLFMWSLTFAIFSSVKWLTWRRTPSTAPL